MERTMDKTKPTYEQLLQSLQNAVWAAQEYQALALRGRRIGNGAAVAAALETAEATLRKTETE